MHEDIVGRRRAERERCNDAARRSKGPLLVGYINAANYYGAPIPRHCTLSVDAVHACVSSANKRRRIKGVVFHVFKGKLDIRKKDYEQFWIASPVMMWAQMAQYSTLEELAAIGASLMSRDKRRRMATRKDFDTYLEISPRFIGRNKCHEALPYMTENTDSPPENTLFGMLKDSGFGMPHRQLSREYRQLIRHIGYGISGLPRRVRISGSLSRRSGTNANRRGKAKRIATARLDRHSRHCG